MALELSQEYLKAIYNYNEYTGILSYKMRVSSNNIIGAQVGSKNNKGYLQTTLRGGNYKLHRLIWMYMVGSFPKDQIDHINGIKDDNRWSNLRECTNSQNCANQVNRVNNKTGIKGLYRRVRKGNVTYVARVCHLGETYGKEVAVGANLEQEVIDELVSWMSVKRRELHKEFTNHG